MSRDDPSRNHRPGRALTQRPEDDHGWHFDWRHPDWPHLKTRATAIATAAWSWLLHIPQNLWHWLRRLSRTTQAILATVLVLLVAVILFLANPNWDWARGFVSSIVSGKLHRPVRIDGHLRVHLFSLTPSATVQGLKIGRPNWAPTNNLADIETLSVKAELLPIFTGRIVLPTLQVDRPVVFAYQDKTGRANWDFSNGAKKGEPLKLPLIKNFIINDGRVQITSLQRQLTFTGIVNAHERAEGGRQAFNLTGDGSLNGRVFKLEATGGPLLNVRTSVPYPFDMKVSAGATAITARGSVTHPFDLGHITAAATVAGRDLADLYDLTGLTFPNTPAYRLAANVTRDGMVYNVRGINGRVGGSDLGGNLKVDISNHGRPYMTGALHSRLLDFKDLGSLFGASQANAPQGASLSATPTSAGPANRLLPDAKLDVQRLRGMDADVTYKAASVRASPRLPLRGVTLGTHLDHGLLVLNPIELTFPQGHLTGTARIDARTDTQTNTVDMRLDNVRVQDFTPTIAGAKPVEGLLDARIKATGGGHSVHEAAASADGEVALAMSAGQIRRSFAELMGVDATKGLFLLLSKDKHQTDVRCAVASFRVQDGVLVSQNIVFDTGVVLVTGKGTVDLHDERLNLVFNGKPKKFRLVRIKAPIIIGGHLSAPKFGIDAKPAIAQTGIAALLSNVAAPLVAVPFAAFNQAKDANCSGLLGQARAQGAPVGR